jgi:molybdopterin-guanine dinucleotide biosynthesis protein A
MNRRTQAAAMGSKAMFQHGGARSPNKLRHARITAKAGQGGAPDLGKQDTTGAPRRRSAGDRSGDDPAPPRWTIWILAGGRSSRMGRDKARIVVAGKTLLQHVRSKAAATGLPVRTIRTDLVSRCGPLGGIVTGLTRARSGWCMFLTCDMPLITPRLIAELRRSATKLGRPVFVRTAKGFGFPLVLRATDLSRVRELIATGQRSLQQLARAVGARALRLPAARRGELSNANTPADLVELRRCLGAGCG